MIFSNSLNVIDAHCGGEPIRIITGGMPTLFGNTMYEKMEYMRNNYDWIRQATMLEPRGLPCGAVLTEPTTREAHIGVFYIDTGGYAPMCGHGTIALGKILVETGMVPSVEPVTTIVMDTPAGLVKTYAVVENGKVKETSFENIPSFLYKSDIKVSVPSLGEIFVDIAYGGNFFVLVDVEPLGLEINPGSMMSMAGLGMKIIKAVNEVESVQHPVYKDITVLEALLFCEKAKNKGDAHRVLDIYGNGLADRSPCGTGTSARMARLFAKGELAINEPFIHESPIGTRFTGKLIRKEKVGEFLGVVPIISGEAFIMGFNHLVIDQEDPLKYGINPF